MNYSSLVLTAVGIVLGSIVLIIIASYVAYKIRGEAKKNRVDYR